MIYVNIHKIYLKHHKLRTHKLYTYQYIKNTYSMKTTFIVKRKLTEETSKKVIKLICRFDIFHFFINYSHRVHSQGATQARNICISEGPLNHLTSKLNTERTQIREHSCNKWRLKRFFSLRFYRGRLRGACLANCK